jgi:hypothetical protein
MTTALESTNPNPIGRVARTKGVSLLPHEYADASTVEELTGMGFSEVYRRFFAPQMRAAADMLRAAQESGMALDRRPLLDRWNPGMTADELVAIYTAPSRLDLGD